MDAVDEEVLRRQLEDALKNRASVRVLTLLPRRVRFRLWLAGRRDSVAVWLAYRDHFRAAEWTWRLTGGWR
jgi:hypothetical protein